MADVKKPIAKAAAKKPAVTPVTAAKTEPAAAKTVETVKAEAVTAPAKAEPVKTETSKKPAAKAEAVKKTAAVKKSAAKAPAKKAAAKPAAKTTAKAAAKPAVVEKVNLQFSGKSYSMEDLMNITKDVWQYDLKKDASDLKNIELYVKPEENVTYYVINGEVTGSFYI